MENDYLQHIRTDLRPNDKLWEVTNYDKQEDDPSYKNMIQKVLNVPSSVQLGQYLGLPSQVTRKRCQVFNDLKDRIWRTLQECTIKFFFFHGRKGGAYKGSDPKPFQIIHWVSSSFREISTMISTKSTHSFGGAQLRIKKDSLAKLQKSLY